MKLQLLAIFRSAYWLALSLVFWLGLHGQLLAQAAEKEEEEAKSWVMSYILIVLTVGLGLFVVVRMGRRRNPKIRRRDDEEDE